MNSRFLKTRCIKVVLSGFLLLFSGVIQAGALIEDLYCTACDNGGINIEGVTYSSFYNGDTRVLEYSFDWPFLNQKYDDGSAEGLSVRALGFNFNLEDISASDVLSAGLRIEGLNRNSFTSSNGFSFLLMSLDQQYVPSYSDAYKQEIFDLYQKQINDIVKNLYTDKISNVRDFDVFMSDAIESLRIKVSDYDLTTRESKYITSAFANYMVRVDPGKINFPLSLDDILDIAQLPTDDLNSIWRAHPLPGSQPYFSYWWLDDNPYEYSDVFIDLSQPILYDHSKYDPLPYDNFLDVFVSEVLGTGKDNWELQLMSNPFDKPGVVFDSFALEIQMASIPDEVTGEVPEPGTLALFMLGFIGIGFKIRHAS